MKTFWISILLVLALSLFSAASLAAEEGLGASLQTNTYSDLNILNENGLLPDGTWEDDDTLTNPELAEILSTAFHRFIAMEEHTQYQTRENKLGEDTFNNFTNLPLVEQKNTWDVLNRLLQNYKNDQTVIPNDLALRIEQTLAKFDLDNYYRDPQPNNDKNGMYVSFNDNKNKRSTYLDNSVWTMPVMTAGGVNNDSSPVSNAIESRLTPGTTQHTILGIRPVQEFEYAVKVALGDFRLYGGINVDSTHAVDFSNFMANFDRVNKASVGVKFNIFESKTIGVGGVVQYDLLNNKNEDNSTSRSSGSNYDTGITTAFVLAW